MSTTPPLQAECLAHTSLDDALEWAERYSTADPLKLAQLQSAVATAHMVIDQLLERNGTIDPF